MIKTIFGKIHGLKAIHLHELEKLYARRVAIPDMLNLEFAQSLASIAHKIGRHVGVLVTRRGEVADVAIGDGSRLYLPDVGRARAAGGRLRALRLIVAKPTRKRENAPLYEMDKDFLTDLEKLRLDAIIQIEVPSTGLPARAVLAYLASEAAEHQGFLVRHKMEHFRDVRDIQIDFLEWVQELESALAQNVAGAKPASQKATHKEAAVLIGVYTSSKKEWEPQIAELRELARTAGVYIADEIVQQRKALDPKTVVGKGKLEEICLHALHKGAELLIFDGELTPSQLNIITDLTDLKVIDRTMLILDIFARRAKTKDGKLQVELAQLQYSLPRLEKKQTGLSRLTGGIGGQGPGETKLEIDRRRAKEAITRLESAIEKLCEQRKLRRKGREDKKIPTLALVGYTNAGKSSLLNKLTQGSVYVKNELFATLDPTSRRLHFPNHEEAILIDTVGFIRDLPKGLMKAFRATLDELHSADLLLHVVDATDVEKERHMEAVHQVLSDLNLNLYKRLLVINKVDVLDPEEKRALEASYPQGYLVSAVTGEGLKALLQQCAAMIPTLQKNEERAGGDLK